LQHGVLNNGLVLDEEFETLAEQFRGAGYRTAAFVSTDAPLGGALSQGFEVWDQYQADTDVEGSRKLYRQAEETVGRAIEWTRSASPDEPFFLWVHVYDPHRPIQPPDEDVVAVRQMIEAYGEDRYQQELVRRGVPGDRRAGYEDSVLYDAEILYADRQLERLHTAMVESGLAQRSLWVVTSDHGQGLGAHDWYGHSKQIYNAQIWVPLLFWFHESATARVVDDRVVEHVDLLPTLAELAGFEPQQILPIQGRSLVPLLRGERPTRDRKLLAFAERSRYIDAGPQRQERGNYEEGSRYSLQDLQLKYILFTDGPDELYDLRVDPYEMRDLIDSEDYAEDREQLLRALVRIIETIPSGRQAETVSAEEIERLRALGYIQ
jgi:arylsulfatase A-like enzyme